MVPLEEFDIRSPLIESASSAKLLTENKPQQAVVSNRQKIDTSLVNKRAEANTEIFDEDPLFTSMDSESDQMKYEDDSFFYPSKLSILKKRPRNKSCESHQKHSDYNNLLPIIQDYIVPS